MRNIDLNLLLMFDILYKEGSVTRAARRLNLTQSAVSHSLRRLRVALNDELFTRGSNGLEPTPRAVSLAAKLTPALGAIRDAVVIEEFDPATTTRCFTIVACSLYLELQAPLVVERIRAVAPRAALHFCRTASFSDFHSEVANYDLAIDVVDTVPAGLCGRALGKEPLVWVAGRASSLVGQKITYEMLQTQPIVQFEVQEGWHRGQQKDEPPFDETIFDRDIRRLWMSDTHNVEGCLYVAEASLAAQLMEKSDFVARLPRAVAERYIDRSELVALDVDFNPGEETLSLIWPRHLDADAGRIWLSDLIRDCYA